jgi:hypothetical protein
MNNRITRRDIVACNWSWSSVGKAVAYRTALQFLRDAGTDTIAIASIKTMMRYHATDAIREARVFTPSR